MHEIVQLKITLKHTKPPVWRRILVETDLSLEDLHYIIQVAMGWTNSHLFEFDVAGESYGFPDEDWGMDDMEPAGEIAIGDILEKPGQKFSYVYDFGDNWEHEVLVEAFLDRDDASDYPRCTGGARACPPEDCGGPGGYAQLLEVLGNPKHPERQEMLDWIGGDIDDLNPAAFDLEERDAMVQVYNEVIEAYAEAWDDEDFME